MSNKQKAAFNESFTSIMRSSRGSTGSVATSTVRKFESKAPSRFHISKMWTARFLFIICLCLVAVCLSLLANLFLTESETDLAEKQFISITYPALKSARHILRRKRLGSVTMASVMGNTFPSSDNWPNVVLGGYEEIASNVLDTSSDTTGSLGFLPIVLPENKQDFEDFAYGYLEKNFPAGTGMSPDGEKGIYSRDFDSKAKSGHQYTTNTTSWGSPNNMLTPYLQLLGPGSERVLMFNLHSLPSRGIILDNVITCAIEEATTNEDEKPCSSISDALFVSEDSDAHHLGPGAVMVEPIYPAKNKAKVTGFITSTLNWIDVLQNVVPEDTRGIDCVLETRNGKFTFHLQEGGPVYVGEGDLHDHRFGQFRASIPLTDSDSFSDSSVPYIMTFYPSSDFFESYSTRNPLLATIGAVCIIIFTSLAFFLYDALVRQEFHNKQVILEAKRKFMRFVSHEVRTPLNSVVMGLKLMQEDVESMTPGTQVVQQPSEMIPYVIKLSQQILDSAENAVTVLSDLLNYDKIEMGQLTLEPTILSIWDLVQSCSEEFRLPFQAKNINFVLDYSPLGKFSPDEETAPPTINSAADLPYDVKEQRFVGDSIRITQVLRNLISNAMKFTPEDGQVTVQLSWVKAHKGDGRKRILEEFKLSNYSGTVAFEPSGFLKLTVTDTGAGMSPDQVAKLFQSGVQFNVNQLQAGKGSGLGLFIAKGIVEQHGGTLSASSEGLGCGTTFTMTLPLHYIPDTLLPEGMCRLLLGRPHAEALELSQTQLDETHASGEESVRDYSLRVLVVDDAAMNRKLLTRLLEKRGYTCDQAEDGQEAVDKVAEAERANNPYDTILMDFEMPNKNGPTAAKEIREMGCDQFIVGITGNVLPEDVALFKENGANWVFPKPVRIPDLEALWLEYGIVGRRVSSEAPMTTVCLEPTQCIL